MQCLEVEDQIQLAHVLKQPIECFDENLDQVEESERGLCRSGDEDEIESRVVTVGYEGRRIVMGLVGGGGWGG